MEHAVSNHKLLAKEIKQKNQKNNAAEVLIPVMTVESNVMCLENNLDEKHPQIQTRKLNKKFKSLDLHYIKPHQQQATKNTKNNHEINYVHVSSEMLSSAGSSNDVSGNTGNSSKNSVNSNDNYEIQPQKQHSYLKSGSISHGKLVRNVERKSSVPDASSLAYKVRTQLKKPKKDVRRAEIVAAVTKRLYTTKKNVDAKPEPEPQVEEKVSNDEEPEELKLCSRARFKLQEISKRALNIHRKMKHLIIDMETQTDFIPTLRVKEIGLNTDKSGGIHTSEVAVNTNMFEFPVHLLLCENNLIHHNVCNHRVNNQFDTSLKSKNSKTVIFKEVSVATEDNYFFDTSNTDILNSDIRKVNSIFEKEPYNNVLGKSCLCMKYVDDQTIKGVQYSHIEQMSCSEPSRSNFSVQNNIPSFSSEKDTTVGGLSKDQLKCCCFSDKFDCDNNEIKSPNVIDFGIRKCSKNFVPGNGINKIDVGVGTNSSCSEIYSVDKLNSKEVQTHINPDSILIKEIKLKPALNHQKDHIKTYNVRNSVGTLTDFYYPSSTLWSWKKCINYSSSDFMKINETKSFKFKRPDTYVLQNISEENISDDSLEICNNFKLSNQQNGQTLEDNKLSQHWNLTNFSSGNNFFSPHKNTYESNDNGHHRPLSTIFSKNNKNPEINKALTASHNYGLSSKIIGKAENLINTSSKKMRLQYGLPPVGLDKIFSEQTNISSNFHSKNTQISENDEQIKFKLHAKLVPNEINTDKNEQNECQANQLFSSQNHSEANNTNVSMMKCHCSDHSEKIDTLQADIKDVLQRLFASNTDFLCNGLLRNQSAQTERVCFHGNYNKVHVNRNESNTLEKAEATDNCLDSVSKYNENNECTHLEGKINTCVHNDQYFNDQGPKHITRNREPKFYLNEESHLKYFSNNLTLSSPFSAYQTEDINQEDMKHSLKTGFLCKNYPQLEDNQQHESIGCLKSKSLDPILPLQNSCVDGKIGSFKIKQEQIISKNGKQDEEIIREQQVKQHISEIPLKQNDIKTDEHLFERLQSEGKTDKNSISDNHKLSSPITLISENMSFFISKPPTDANGTICSKHIKQKDEESCSECLESQNVQSLLRNINQYVGIDTERPCCMQKLLISQDSKCNCLEMNIPATETELLGRNKSSGYHSKPETSCKSKHTIMKESIPSSDVFKETTTINIPTSNNTNIIPTLKKKQTHPMEKASCSNNNSLHESHSNKTTFADKAHKQNTDFVQTNQIMTGNITCTKTINQTSSNIMVNKNSIPSEHLNESTGSTKKKNTRKKKKNYPMTSPRSRMDTLNITDPMTHGWGNAGAVGTWFTLSTFVKKANTLLKSLGEVSEMMEKVKNKEPTTFTEPQTIDRISSFKTSVQPRNQCNTRITEPLNGEHSRCQTESFSNKYCEESVPIPTEPFFNNYVSDEDNKLYENIKFNELSEYLYTNQNGAPETLNSVSVETYAYGNHHSTTRKSLPCFTKTNKSHCLQTRDSNVPQQIQKELPLLNFPASHSSTSSVPYQSGIQHKIGTFPSFSKVQTKRYLQESYSLPDFNQHEIPTVGKKAHCCFGNVFNNIVNYQRHKKKQIHIACLYTTGASVDNFGIRDELDELRSIPRCLEMARYSPRAYKQYLLDLRRQIASDSGYCLK